MPHCKTGVFWLEDDWQITTQTPLTRWLNQYRVKYGKGKFGNTLLPCPGSLKQKQAVIEAQGYDESAWWYMSLVPEAKVSFQPSIWSKALFEIKFYQPLVQVEAGVIDDPEEVCWNSLNEQGLYQRLSVLADPLFHDVGHRWIAELNLKKWPKKDRRELTMQGAATYHQKSKAAATVQANLTGFFLLSDFVFNSPLKYLAQTTYRNGKLKARLPGIPFFAFELIVADDLNTEIYFKRMHAWAEKSEFMKVKATMCWQLDAVSGRPEQIDIRSRMGNFSGEYRKNRPLCALWLAPIQSLVGLGLYLFTFYKLMQGLKK